VLPKHAERAARTPRPLRLLTRRIAGLDRGHPATGSTNVRVARAQQLIGTIADNDFSGEQQ